MCLHPLLHGVRFAVGLSAAVVLRIILYPVVVADWYLLSPLDLVSLCFSRFVITNIAYFESLKGTRCGTRCADSPGCVGRSCLILISSPCAVVALTVGGSV